MLFFIFAQHLALIMRGKIILDIGNSRIKWAYVDHFIATENYHTHPTSGINDLFEHWNKEDIDTIILSNVSSHSIDFIQNNVPNKKVIEIRGNSPSPLKMQYTTPETLGPDRFLAAIGAYEEFKGQHILVVDFGTCIKYEVISANGDYLGGAISPGINMRFKSMHTFTGKLPLMEGQIPQLHLLEFGKSTDESMYVGVFQGILGEIKQFIHNMEKRNGKLCIIFSGGYAQEFANYLENHIFVRSNLVLSGLVQIIRHNEY